MEKSRPSRRCRRALRVARVAAFGLRELAARLHSRNPATVEAAEARVAAMFEADGRTPGDELMARYARGS